MKREVLGLFLIRSIIRLGFLCPAVSEKTLTQG